MIGSSVDDLFAALGPPAIDLEGDLVDRLRCPMVYVWIRRLDAEREGIEYIGKSLDGICRPLSVYHHRADQFWSRGDRLLCWRVESPEAAAALERDLIARYRPRLNGRRAGRAWQ